MSVGNAQSTLAAHARAKDCNAGGHNSKPPLNFSTHVLYNKAFRRDAGVKHGHDRIEPPRTTGARCNRGHASSLDAVSQAAGRKQRSLVLAVEIDHGPAAAGLRRFVDFAGMAVDIDYRPIWAAGRADNWNHREPVAEDSFLLRVVRHCYPRPQPRALLASDCRGPSAMRSGWHT